MRGRAGCDLARPVFSQNFFRMPQSVKNGVLLRLIDWKGGKAMEVVKGPGSREEEKISRLIKTYERDLLRLCCVMLKDAAMAEDAVQETFIKAYRNLRAFRGDSSEKTWLIRIAINVCKDMRRTAWFRNIGRMVSLNDVELAQKQELDVSSALIGEIMRLPEKYKEVILLHYYEGLNQSEIAGILRVSSATVHRRLIKARALLKELLKGGNGLEAG
ncbi:MAG: sigma-70 family RNA polymerase sigma factor [Candidatus Ventricola sp.]